jgi:hypothetical protein
MFNQINPNDSFIDKYKSRVWEDKIIPCLFDLGFIEQDGKYLFKDFVLQKEVNIIIVVCGNNLDYLPICYYSIIGYFFINGIIKRNNGI